MLQSKIGRNFFFCFLLLNLVLALPFVYLAWQRPDILSAFLPGQFGPGLTAEMTGNLLVLSVIVLLNALLLLTFGIGGTWHALWAGLRVSPRKLRRFLHERTGIANDIAGVVAAAIQEEEKEEIHYLDRARGLLFTGIVLFAVAVPALCIAYVDAAPDGAPIFETAGQAVPNNAVTVDQIVRFAVDQLAALALDIPAIFHLRATPMEINGANLILGVLVVLYRTLTGLGLVLLFVGMRRARALLFNALEVAMPVADIVAMDPVLQDGHGHHEEHVEHVVHHHVHEEAPAPVENSHDHAHEEPAPDALEDGDVVEVEDAHHVVHHAVIQDHVAPHAAPEHAVVHHVHDEPAHHHHGHGEPVAHHHAERSEEEAA
jgi:hypothetical protein